MKQRPDLFFFPFIALFLSMACDGTELNEDGSPANDQTGENGQSNGQNDANGGFDWAGTWIVDAEYTVTCSNMGGPQSADRDGTWTVDLSGDNDDLVAVPEVNYEMAGVGSDSQLVLTGTFPLQGSGSQNALTDPNQTNISFTLDEVLSADEAKGTIGGEFATANIGNCELSDTWLYFSR